MTWTPGAIRRALGGRLIGNPYMKRMVCRALQKLPDETIARITKTVWYISAPNDAWAFTLRGSEISKYHIIILSSRLFDESERQISYTILHETGHVLLEHRNSIGVMQTRKEIRKQEDEADLFAKTILRSGRK